MGREDPANEQWETLERLLPPRKPTGRPPRDHRQTINGILWVLRTGAPWRDLPGRDGPLKTVYSRFYRWQQDGTWDRSFADVQDLVDGAAAWKGVDRIQAAAKPGP